MKINDILYGNYEIKEEVLKELIKCPSVNRLKDISQLGMPDEYLSFKGFSRYEHSIGVMLLLKKLNASLEEQVAGLLHDVSHTPFSHVVDWVIGDPTKEDYQDNNHLNFLKKSEIPKILKKYNLDVEEISNFDKFSLLEKEQPKLCADRIDYSMRQLAGRKEKRHIENILNDLDVYNNQIIFNSPEIAKLFGNEYMELQTLQWAGDEMRTRYYILSEILKKALKNDIISSDFLYGTEKPILESLKKSNDNFILDNLNILSKGFFVVEDKNGIELKKKFRYIDPEVKTNGSYMQLSNISEEYFHLINSEKERSKEVKRIKIIPVNHQP